MSELNVLKYDPEQKCCWNDFVSNAKNGLFLFQRDYMDYHSDRFEDCSLLFFEDERLRAIMPANRQADALISHGGLTFGGVLSDSRMNVELMLKVFDALKSYLRERGVGKVIYKAVPHIYHRLPSEEDLYCLYRHGAPLVRRDISSTIDMKVRLPFTKGRKWG